MGFLYFRIMIEKGLKLSRSILLSSLLRYLAIIVSTVLLILFSFEAIGKRALAAYLIYALIIVLIDSLIQKRFWANTVLCINAFIFTVLSLLEVGHSFLFNDRFASSTFFILFETNMQESADFLRSTVSSSLFVVLMLFVFSLIVSFISIYKNDKLAKSMSFKILRVDIRYYVIIFFVGVLFFVRASFFPFVLLAANAEYHQEKAELLAMTSDKTGGDFTKVHHTTQQEDEVYVLVIGESTTRRVMGVYGYYRNTTPLLNAMKDDLFVYKDVVTPHTHTISALDKVLTLSNFKDTLQDKQGSIIQLFNKAGFTTYWLSNQKPIGVYESTVTALSHSADNRVFVNSSANQLDKKLFEPYSEALNDTCSRKLIILHLMGTHLQYDKRYPKAYDKFTEKPKTQFDHEKAWYSINTYDNAVLYNDYIVSSLITKLKEKNARSFLLYFSDHGEEVFHDKNFAIHAEYDETRDMYEIPFILWTSSALKEDSTYVYDVNRKYSTEDMLYSLADLANVDFDENDSSRSIVNADFQFETRYITERKNYDEVYK